MKKNDLEYQFHLLEKIVGKNEEPIELYNIDELPNMHLLEYYKEIVSFIISENRKGKIPISRDLHEANFYFYNYEFQHLQEMDLICFPNIMELACLLGKPKGGRMDFSSLPENISSLLDSYKGSKFYSWRKRFKNLYAKRWPKCYIALFYDKDGPIYKNCFHGIELNYKPKKIGLREWHFISKVF
jgi:hypothetical protein